MNFPHFFTQPPDLSHIKNFYGIGYIDPGTGYVFSSALPAILGVILAFLSSVLVFFRSRLIPYFKKHPFVTFITVFLFIAISANAIVYYTHTMNKVKSEKRVVVLGIDGMDPDILENGWNKNLFSHLRLLREQGTYSHLQTTIPAQSPIAWASFITGVWPAKHGIYDFLSRDPGTYALDLTFSNPDKNNLGAPPFWQLLESRDIPITVLFLPDMFPPISVKGKILAGMGVPDIIGTQGAFTLITSSDKYSLDSKWRGKLIKVVNSNDIKAVIEGPKYSQLKERKIASIPITISKNINDKSIVIKISGKNVTLKEKDFSDWVVLDFKIDFFTSIKGMVRFYLKSLNPDFSLYITPINIVPDKSVFSISYPKKYASEIKKSYGNFYTQGFPHDTWALEEDVFDNDTFLKQADDIFDQRKRIILGELNRSKSGLFIGYFGILDTIQHMFWHDKFDVSSKYKSTIEQYYTKIDDVIGEVMENLNEDDTLILLSDHGFAEFQYEFNVNSWLRDHGYLTLAHGDIIGKEYLDNVDWSKTKAYAVGYNSIYINLKGREKLGIVTENEFPELTKKLVQELESYINPLNGQIAVKQIYTKEELGMNKNDKASPDLFIGYYKGIRSSWDTVVGGTPQEIVQKRESKWSGDHLFDFTEVPGVLLVNKKNVDSSPTIIDLAPTILKLFGITPSPSLDGKALW